MHDVETNNEQKGKKKTIRYYWLKLQDDFFKAKEIKKLRSIAGGDTYTIIYLKIMLLSVHTEGIIGFDGIEDTIYEELALELDENPEDVRITVNFLLKYGLMVEVADDGVLLTKVPDMIGSETSKAELMRRLRAERAEKEQLVTFGNNVTDCYEKLPYKRIKENNIENNIYNKTEKGQKKKRKVYTQEFEMFWSAYPRKEGKGEAFKSFERAINHSGAELQDLLNGIDKYKKSEQWQRDNGKFIPHPATWLNQKRWEDSPVIAPPGQTSSTRQTFSNKETDMLSAMQRAAERDRLREESNYEQQGIFPSD